MDIKASRELYQVTWPVLGRDMPYLLYTVKEDYLIPLLTFIAPMVA